MLPRHVLDAAAIAASMATLTRRDPQDGADLYALAFGRAHEAATSPWNRRRTPTRAQELAGNYYVGKVDWQGQRIHVENPAHTVREGTDPDGVYWRSVMKATYGYFAGTRGADGDPVDVFLGPMPESRAVWVLNQRNADGTFDEHKVLAGFPDERAAVDAYRLSYSAGWDRYGPPLRVSVAQLKWWLRYGDTSRELTPELLPPEPEDMDETPATLSRVIWNDDAQPMSGLTLDAVLYRIRVHDAADGLLMDPLTVADVLEGAEVVKLDALVTMAGKLQQQLDVMTRLMNAAGAGITVAATQITEPVRRFGGVHVAWLFELSDGQTITFWFHNPDSTPARLTPTDQMVSWKVQLNKKDITIVVAPEKGQDLNVRDVARRVMRLAEKNSPAFQRANAKRAERMANIDVLKATVEAKTEELRGLMNAIDVAKIAKEERATDPAADRALAIRRALIPMGFEGAAAVQSAPGTMEHVMLKRDGDVTLKIKTVQSDGASMLYLARMEGGALVADMELPDDTGRSPEDNAKLAASLVSQLKASPIQPGTPDYVEWEDALTRLVEERMEADRSDAQGMVEAKDMIERGILRRLFGEGMSPERAYERLFGDENPVADDEEVKPPPGPSREVLLQREAEGQSWGIGSPSFYGVIPDGDELPDDFMPTDNRLMAADMGAIAKEHGEAIAVQIKPDSDKPFRVLLVFNEDGTGVGSQWAATAAEAYAMVKGAQRITKDPAPAESAEAKFLRDVKAGAMDKVPLGELFQQIEAAVQKLADAGQLTGDVDADASEALRRWVELESQANG